MSHHADVWLHFANMRGKRILVTAVLITVVAACTPQPPPYESQYTPPPPTAPPAPPLPPGASFVDDFDRPDTDLGLGPGWDMLAIDEGNLVLQPAADGFIRDGHYASASEQSVFAVRDFRSTVRRVGAEARWTRVGEGSVESLIMTITANDLLISAFLQLAVSPAGWAVTTRRDGGIQRVIDGTFDPPLELDREYRFEMDAADGSVTVRVPGAEKTGRVGTIGLLSERAFWRHAFAPTDRPIGVQFSVNMVWAVEEGEPLEPIPDD